MLNADVFSIVLYFPPPILMGTFDGERFLQDASELGFLRNLCLSGREDFFVDFFASLSSMTSSFYRTISDKLLKVAR